MIYWLCYWYTDLQGGKYMEQIIATEANADVAYVRRIIKCAYPFAAYFGITRIEV